MSMVGNREGSRSSSFFAVVTTIREPTTSIRRLLSALRPWSAQLIIIGDRGGPSTFDAPGSSLLSIDDQRGLPFQLTPLLPENHYARKNIGYLEAIARGALSIYETDDDNHPLPHWTVRQSSALAVNVGSDRWLNVYSLFTEEKIWPRGYPLRAACASHAVQPSSAAEIGEAPIQQCLVDGAPDVDAVWRLVMEHDVRFRQRSSVRVRAEVWCPFNSQATWWFPEAFPLMYLPSLCSMRTCDIWRGYVAQRCLWELGYGVVFHAPDAEQTRNYHDPMADFVSEIPCYLHVEQFTEVLGGVILQSGRRSVGANLHRCYEALVAAGQLPATELQLVEAWLGDLEVLGMELRI